MDESARTHILDMIESGKITAAEGLHLLQALKDAPDDPAGLEEAALKSSVSLAPDEPFLGSEVASGKRGPLALGAPPAAWAETRPAPGPPLDLRRWKDWWQVPFWLGLAVMVWASWRMYTSLQASGPGWGFFLALIPFLIGVGIMALAYQARNAPWLHLQVEQPAGEWPSTIRLSFPLPLGAAAWFFRTFGDRIPNLPGASLDQMLVALGSTTNPSSPLYLEVEEEDGEKVKIYIG